MVTLSNHTPDNTGAKSEENQNSHLIKAAVCVGSIHMMHAFTVYMYFRSLSFLNKSLM